MKKQITFLLLFTFGIASTNTTMSADSLPYELYKERVTLLCDEYKANTSNSELIYLFDESNVYPDLWTAIGEPSDLINDGKEKYEENMNAIYDCATQIVHLRALKTIKGELLSNSPRLQTRLTPKLDKRINDIEAKIKSTGNRCKVNSDSNSITIKNSVLKQTTYELCRYSFYLEYLRAYNQATITPLQEGGQTISILQVVNDEGKRRNMINSEADRVMRTFNVTYKAYTEYENNLIVHIMLDLLKEDYLVLREEIHKTLNPLNQVVYKISNAMKK